MDDAISPINKLDGDVCAEQNVCKIALKSIAFCRYHGLTHTNENGFVILLSKK